MGLRRGFKTEANATSREFRAELGLEPEAPLCPFAAAEHLDVPIQKLTSFRSLLPEETSLLIAKGTAVSAFTACFGTDRLIIYNDALPLTRSHADIMHEIAHMLLIHPPHSVCADDGGRHYDQEMEEEANWLGPALLVSEEAALHVVRRALDVSTAAQLYGVSRDLMRMRLNVTGAQRRVDRAA